MLPKMLRTSTALLTLLCLCASGFASDENLYRTIDKILKKTPLIDGHNDLPMVYTRRVQGNFQEMPFDSDLTSIEKPTHTDRDRLRQGRMGGQFWSVFIPITKYPGAAGDTSDVLTQIDVVHRMIETYPDDLALALTAKDIRRIHRKGKIASMMGIEGGHAIENSLATLRMVYKLGVRYMTLTHGKGLKWADSATDEERIGGLSSFGEEVVREMNRLGMLVDLSHVSVATMNDALDVSTAPVIFSHSSSYSVTAHKRNVPDDILLRLKENNGVVMVTFFPSYVSENVRKTWADAFTKIRSETSDPAEQAKRFRAMRSTLPRPVLADVADHIDHIRDLIGVDHIGVGGDYDGMPPGPIGLDDVSTYPNLFVELLKRGYSKQDIAKIAGENVLRVMAKAEQIAKKEQKTRSPSTMVFVDTPTPEPASNQPSSN
jgi:membrane dipeptidase